MHAECRINQKFKYNVIRSQKLSNMWKSVKRNGKVVKYAAFCVIAMLPVYLVLNPKTSRILGVQPPPQIVKEYQEIHRSLNSPEFLSKYCVHFEKTHESTALWNKLKHIQNLPKSFFYNRVPKTGSKTIQVAMRSLNRVNYDKSSVFYHAELDEFEKKEIINKFRRHKKYKKSYLYDRHTYFIDFKRYGEQNPIYFNIIREPLEHFISDFYYKRQTSYVKKQLPKILQNMTIEDCVRTNYHDCGGPEEVILPTVHFFCGYDDFCKTNGELALKKAISNIDEYYILVGLSEDIESFVYLMEYILPDPFSGISKRFSAKPRVTGKRKMGDIGVSEDVQEELKYRLRYEYKFYEYVKNKFYNLFCHWKQTEAEKTGEMDIKQKQNTTKNNANFLFDYNLVDKYGRLLKDQVKASLSNSTVKEELAQWFPNIVKSMTE